MSGDETREITMLSQIQIDIAVIKNEMLNRPNAKDFKALELKQSNFQTRVVTYGICIGIISNVLLSIIILWATGAFTS